METVFPSLFISLFGIFLLVIIITALSSIIGAYITIPIFIGKTKQHSLYGYYIFLLICSFLTSASWFMNFGWYRVFLTWIPIPYIHFILFLVINSLAIFCLKRSKPLKVMYILSNLTFMFAYFAFPDGDDFGGSYMFFTLIRNSKIIAIAEIAAIVLFAINVLILFIEVIFLIDSMVRARSEKKLQSSIEESKESEESIDESSDTLEQ